MKYIHMGSGHAHQTRAFKYAVKIMGDGRKRSFLIDRKRFVSNGMLLADGVGMGKTYEALATAVTWLQRKSLRRRRWSPRVLILVPPQLVRKWRDEVCLPDRWPKYLRRIRNQTRVYECFSQPIVIERSWNLEDLLDKKTGSHLTGGFYIVNWRQLGREGAEIWETRRRNLIKRTPWDVVIIDEAHLLPGGRFEDVLQTLQHRGTRVLLLTATPFQLEPSDIKYLFWVKFLPRHGWDADRASDGIYNMDSFSEYRKRLRMAMQAEDDKERNNILAEAKKAKFGTENLLRRLIIRSPSPQGRIFYLADNDGKTREIATPARCTEPELKVELKENGLIGLGPQDTYYYLAGLERLLPIDKAEQVSGSHFDGFRHLLSSFSNFMRTKVGKIRIPEHSIKHFLDYRGDDRHPKVVACVNLVERLVSEELKAVRSGRKGHIGKIVVFVHFIDGTLGVLKSLLQKRIKRLLDGDRSREEHPYAKLRSTTERLVEQLESDLKSDPNNKCYYRAREILARLRRTLGIPGAKSGGSKEGYARAVARLVLSRQAMRDEMDILEKRLREAAKDIKRLKIVGSDRIEAHRIEALSLEDRLLDVLESLCDRYKARDLVLTLSGEIDTDEAAARRTAFNAPGAPLILIASPVGQVGIDLQAYAEHVIHYELEWNPARMEQREGRVDRLGRRGEGKVKVYYLICKDTYDERMFLQISRRQLWHRLLIGKNRTLVSETERGAFPPITDLGGSAFERLSLDLRPR